MDEMDPCVQRFLEHARKLCQTHNIRLRMVDQHYFLVEGKRAYAFFEHPSGAGGQGEIRVALKSKFRSWLEQLVHEMGHLEQWIEQSALWVNALRMYEYVAKLRIDDAPIPHGEHIHYCLAQRALELDCEQRAVRMIKQWELPLDIEAYIGCANVDIWSYTEQIKSLVADMPLLRYPDEFFDPKRP